MTYKTGVESFWDWFRTMARRFYDTIEAQRCSDLQPEVSKAVDRWLGGMAWVFGPGKKKDEHSFTLSPEGIFHKQFLTDYWLARAPKLDGWCFYSSRQPSDSLDWKIEIGENTFAGEEMWVSPVEVGDTECFDIAVWHPKFAKLDRSKQLTVVYLWLDEVLGEDGTMNWIGEIKITDQRLREAMLLRELGSHIQEVSARRGWKKFPPGHAYSSYRLPECEGDFPRADTRAGTTCNLRLINQYLRAKGEMDNPLEGTGADFVFVSFNSGILPKGNEAHARGEIEDLIEHELEAAKSGRVLGGAFGLSNSYIDIVIFDGDQSVELIRQILLRRNLPKGTAIHYFAAAKRSSSVTL